MYRLSVSVSADKTKNHIGFLLVSAHKKFEFISDYRYRPRSPTRGPDGNRETSSSSIKIWTAFCVTSIWNKFLIFFFLEKEERQGCWPKIPPPPPLDFRDVSFLMLRIKKKLLSSYFLNFFRSKDGLFELVWQEDGTVTFKGMATI